MTTNELIENNMGLIKGIASKFYGIDKEDLIQVGVIGLLSAYQNFKDTTTAKFSTYAYPYIFGKMYEYVNGNRNIKLSRNLLKIYKLVEKTKYDMAQKTGVIPSYQEVALYLELDYKIVNEAVIGVQAMISLDDEANELNLYEVLPDKSKTNIDLKLDLDDSFKVLNKEEKEIIRARYYEDLTQSEVAKKLNMTQVMVSRYEKKGLEKMRSVML